MPATSPSRRVGIPRRGWVILAVVLAVVIGVVSLLPPRGTPGMEIADLGELRATVGHAIGYLLLAFAAVMAQQAPRPWLTVVLASAYGVVLELAQGAIGLRSMQFTDVLANCVGAMAGALIGALLLRRLT